jgi:outer membrane protein TolC
MSDRKEEDRLSGDRFADSHHRPQGFITRRVLEDKLRLRGKVSFRVAFVSAIVVAVSGTPALGQLPGGSFNAPASSQESSSTPAMSVPSISPSQNPLFGSVPTGQPTGKVIPLSALDAIDRGLKYNLALILSEQATTAARGARLKALSDVLPKVTGQVGETLQQINLAAFGISVPGIPNVVGPFGVFDARVAASGNLFDLHYLNLYRSRSEDINAAQLDMQNVRDLIVLVVGGMYMQTLAGEARIATVEAQLNTAQALYQQAADMKNAGMVPGIDVLRSQVEMQVQQQRLLAFRNDFAKQKLSLARIIGLPTAQEFNLTEKIPVTPATPLTLDQAIARALRDRPDYQRAQSQVRSAELNRRAMVAENLPTVKVNADIGAQGRNPGDSAMTYTTAGVVNLPIFQGGKVRGDVLQADALLHQRQAALSDLRGQIEFDVRNAFLDLQSSADQVKVAQSSVQLAEEALTQARDRFRAGVATSVEVVQTQEQVAATNDNYINSTFAYNVAKLSLARSLGIAERAVKDFLGGKR